MQGYIGEGLDLFSGVVGELVSIGLPLNKTPVTFRVHKLSKYRWKLCNFVILLIVDEMIKL